METKKLFVIIDSSTNTNAIYISESGENCELIENAETFTSEEEAQKVINQFGWQDWAMVKEL